MKRLKIFENIRLFYHVFFATKTRRHEEYLATDFADYAEKYSHGFTLFFLDADSFDSFDKTPFGYFDLAQYKRLRAGSTGKLMTSFLFSV